MMSRYRLLLINFSVIWFLTVSSQQIKSCTSAADCTIAGCSCVSNFCVHTQTGLSNLNQCPACSSNSDCTVGSDDECNTSQKCKSCTVTALRPALAQCAASSGGSGGGTGGGTTPTQPDQPSGTGSPVRCTTDSQCTVSGCTCVIQFCAVAQTFAENVQRCSPCTSNADCSGEGNRCVGNQQKVCLSCAARALGLGARQCIPGGSATPPNPQTPQTPTNPQTPQTPTNPQTPQTPTNPQTPQTPTNPQTPQTPTNPQTPQTPGTPVVPGPAAPAPGAGNATAPGACTSNSNCINGCACVGGACRNLAIVQNGAANCNNDLNCINNLNTRATAACKPKCISSLFLFENGLAHAALRHFGAADVLCIPGLPCGSPGHLLRQCTNSVCELFSYQQVCKGRDDCVASKMAVSQLKHSFDWSSYRVESEGSSLSLTSLSADPDTTSSISVSRIIAKIVDLMNRVGLGGLCDFIAAFPYNMETARKALHFTDSL